MSDQTNELNASGTGYTTVNESYGYKALNTTSGTYTGADLGVVTNEKQVTTNTNVTVSTAWTYQWWDSAQVLTIKDTGVDPNNPNTVYWYPGLSNFTYDDNGHLLQNLGYSGAQVGSAASRTVNYVEDPYGEILSEDEMDGPPTGYSQGPQQHFDYLNGAQIANVGNNPIAGETSYQASLVNPSGGQIISGSFADFDANFNAINAQYASTDPGHIVRLMAPQFVKPYVRSNKNDAADAEAICEAVSRPTMRFVPIKNVEQQAVLSLHRVRQGFVKALTAQANQIRGLLAEFGLIVPHALAISPRVCQL